MGAALPEARAEIEERIRDCEDWISERCDDLYDDEGDEVDPARFQRPINRWFEPDHPFVAEEDLAYADRDEPGPLWLANDLGSPREWLPADLVDRFASATGNMGGSSWYEFKTPDLPEIRRIAQEMGYELEECAVEVFIR